MCLRELLFIIKVSALVIVILPGCNRETREVARQEQTEQQEQEAAPTPKVWDDYERETYIGGVEHAIANHLFPEREMPHWSVKKIEHYQDVSYVTVEDVNAENEQADFIMLVYEFEGKEPNIAGYYERFGEQGQWKLVAGEDKYTTTDIQQLEQRLDEIKKVR